MAARGLSSTQPIGRAGGLAVFEKYGSEHMSKIGKQGQRVFRIRYKWVPVFQSGWALIERETSKVRAFVGSVPGRR